MLQALEEFAYATSLDLNMGYYTIKLDSDAQKLCNIVTPFGKYQYLRIPMGMPCSRYIFQEKMSDLMQHLLDISCSFFEDHLERLECVLKILPDKGLRVKAEKSTFCANEIEYLGYWISRSGIQPIPAETIHWHGTLLL
jgi:hypothetical protein